MTILSGFPRVFATGQRSLERGAMQPLGTGNPQPAGRGGDPHGPEKIEQVDGEIPQRSHGLGVTEITRTSGPSPVTETDSLTACRYNTAVVDRYSGSASA